MEKVRLDHIRWLLEIIEREHNNELFLYEKNLQELSTIPFPYTVPVIPCSLPKDLIKGEHFILADLLKFISGSSSQAGSDQEPQAEFAQEALTIFVRPD